MSPGRIALGFAIGFIAVIASQNLLIAAEPMPKYFVVHCTALETDPPGQAQDEAFYEAYFKRKKKQGSVNRGYGLLMPSGAFRQWWPFEKRDVYGTKTETCSSTRKATFGTFINIEVAYDCSRHPNPASPTAAQYKGLAEVYARAYAAYGPLTVVSHKEVDRGLEGGHSDPYNFDFVTFYAELASRGLDMSKIKRITNERHAIPSLPVYSHVAPPNLDSTIASESSRPDDCKDYPSKH